ncbi:MAG: Putative H(+)-transporting two-sector ATPase subunit H.a [Synergistales bacterium 54_9]|nr:MAG: Putative H(+)-transporting two-sector ATPase subunit H.a [Synergistales bacterium 54_9]
MPFLEEALTVLLNAEKEALRKKGEARAEAEEILERARRDFQKEREARLRAVREQAQAVIEVAEQATGREVGQIVRLGQQEMDEMTRRFQTHAQEVVEAVVEETAEEYVRRGVR